MPPDQVLDPYDETLTTKGTAERKAWASGVLAQLRQELGDISRYDVEIHAGAAYTNYGLRSGLESAGARVDLPAAGLPLGRQLAFYRDMQPPARTRRGTGA